PAPPPGPVPPAGRRCPGPPTAGSCRRSAARCRTGLRGCAPARRGATWSSWAPVSRDPRCPAAGGTGLSAPGALGLGARDAIGLGAPGADVLGTRGLGATGVVGSGVPEARRPGSSLLGSVGGTRRRAVGGEPALEQLPHPGLLTQQPQR